MMTSYTCDYLHNSGKTCDKACTRPEGCRLHFKTKKRWPCSECGKPTATVCGWYAEHIRGYYVMQYYNKLRDKAQRLDLIKGAT